MELIDTDPPSPRILVIGVGGVGLRDVDFLYRKKMQGLRTLAIDTDRSALERHCANTRVLIGSRLCSGEGCKGDVDCGRTAAQRSRTTIEEQCAGADVILLCAGLGRGTGSGAGPVVADIARKTGALVIGILFIPSLILVNYRIATRDALDEVLEIADSVLLFDYDSHYLPLRPYHVVFPYDPWHFDRNQIMEEAIIQTLQDPSTDRENQDRFRRIFSQKGAAVMMRVEGPDTDAIPTLLKNCERFSSRKFAISGGKGAYILLFSEQPITITDADAIAIRRALDLDDDAEILCEWREGGWNGRTWIIGLVTGLREPADGRDPWRVYHADQEDEKNMEIEEEDEY